MSKKHTSPALSYLQSLGLTCKIRNNQQIYDFLTAKLGKNESELIDKETACGTNKVLSFYKFKNETFERSLNLTLAFDGHFMREVGDWLAEHKNIFGKRILDCGCDNGTLTCFLASICPDSEIVAIDRCQEAVENARLLAQRLKLTNVEFRTAAIEEFPLETFDTVFASRVLHENGNVDANDPEMRYWEHAEVIAENRRKAIDKLCSCVSPLGNLVVICRDALDVSFLGNLVGFSKNSFLPDLDHLKHFFFHDCEAEEPEEFVVACFTKSDKPMPLGGDDINQDGTLANLFCCLKSEDGFNFNTSSYDGDEADLMKTIHCAIPKKIIRLFTEDQHLFYGEYSIWENSSDPTAIWGYCRNNNCHRELFNFDTSMLDKCLQGMSDWKEKNLKNGGLVAEEM